MKTSSRRRRFLTMLGIGGAAAVTASKADVQPVRPADESAAAPGKGYQLTEHVRKYYRTARM